MKKWSLILIIVALGVHCYSQDKLFVMHPLVGDTIDKTEKLNYFLFPQIVDSVFRYCTITHSGTNYIANVTTMHDAITTHLIDSAEMAQDIVRLNKLMEYHASQGKRDSVKNEEQLKIDLKAVPSDHLQKPILNSEMKDKIFYDVRTTTRMNEDAERLDRNRQGTELLSGQGHIEFYKRRKKK